MELKQILKNFKGYFKILIIFTVFFAIIGTGLNFYLPIKYYATGSIFVKRSIYPYANDHFTYEGYYGQQAAMAYTNSVISLLESPDMHALVLKETGLEVNLKNLKKLARNIRVKKTGPQVIEVTVRSDTNQNSQSNWEALLQKSAESLIRLANTTDPFVGIVRISDDLVVHQSYRDPVTFGVGGAIFGFFIASLSICLKIYFSGDNKRKK